MRPNHYFISILFSISLSFGQGLRELPKLDRNVPSSDSTQYDSDNKVRDYYHFRMEDDEMLDVNVQYGFGELNLKANQHDHRFDGSVLYLPSFVTPNITYQTTAGEGSLFIGLPQKSGKTYPTAFHRWKSEIGNEFHNEAEFMLPPAIPLNLTVDFGLGEAEVDFSTLTINYLDMNCGLGTMEVSMTRPNKTIAEYLTIDTGLGEFEGEGLGNFRAKRVSIDVGMGSAEIDMRGKNLVDMEIDISVGLGSMELILPEKANIRIAADHNFLSSVTVHNLQKSRSGWVSDEWKEGLPTINVDANVGMGSIEIRVRN